MELPQLILFALFIFALGACIGSFLNVVIWRLPNRGREVIFQNKRAPMTLSWPPSHCPVCDAPIHWYQNIPIFSWLALKAKCANCKTQIPVRYPLVELGTAILFTGFYLAYFAGPAPQHWQPSFSDLRDWPQNGVLALHLFMIAALLAASAIDADIFEIPLAIPWLLIAVGMAASVVLDHPAIWKLNLNNAWWLAKPIAGAAVGLVIANILLQLKLIPNSFAEETQHVEPVEPETNTRKKTKKEESPKPQEQPMPPPPKLTRFGISAISTGILILLSVIAWCALPVKVASLITVSSGILIFLIGVLARDAGQLDVTDEVLDEVGAPHARREVLRELPFLLVPVLCAIITSLLPFELPQLPWLARLLGSLFGIMAGGGIVWLVRITGTLALNKRAMGIGDVHLMAGVGAITGAPLAVIAFFMAPFIGLLWVVVLKITKKPNVLPYGPWLSVASIFALLIGNPLVAWYLQQMFR